MTRCHYSDILQFAASLAGLDYDRTVANPGLDDAEEATLRLGLNAFLTTLWARAKWPGITRVEQRAFRAFWSSGTTYGNGATAAVEVFDPETDQYFQSLVAANLNNAPTLGEVENSAYWALCKASYSGPDWAASTVYAVGAIVYREELARYYQCHTAHTSGASFGGSTYWGILWPFEPYVAFAQTGETVISDQAEIILWTANPRLTTRATVIPSMLTENGIAPTGNYPARPYVEFKVACPNLRGEIFDSTATYTGGTDQVQFVTSSGGVAVIDFYECQTTTTAGESPTTAPSKWSVVEIPDYFKTWLGAKAALLFLVGDSDPRYSIAQGLATEAEENLADLLYRTQRQNPRARVQPYPMAA